MASVTIRARTCNQPKGGYLTTKEFKKVKIEDGRVLNKDEYLDPRIIGLTVDYLSRYLLGTTKEESFSTSLKGARIIREYDLAKKYLEEIKGLDDNSIIYATYLVNYDSYYRNGNMRRKLVLEKPVASDIENIRIMINRTIEYFGKFKFVKTGISFDGAYTEMVHSGEADILTEDSIYDVKVLRKDYNKCHIMQLLIYYTLSTNSYLKQFEGVKYLGFFNPRYNTASILSVDDISENLKKILYEEIIDYNHSYDEKYEQGIMNQFDIMNIMNIDEEEFDYLRQNEGLDTFVLGHRFYVYKNKFIPWYEEYSKKNIDLKLVSHLNSDTNDEEVIKETKVEDNLETIVPSDEKEVKKMSLGDWIEIILEVIIFLCLSLILLGDVL